MPRTDLSDRFCRSAKTIEGRQIEFFDSIVKGLSLLVSPGGTKTFYLNYTRPADGRRARMKIGRYPEISLAGARERAREGRGAIGEGSDPLAEIRAHAVSLAVSDLVENYINRHAMTKKSGPAIARRLRRNVSDLVGSVKLSEFHRRDITRCIDAVKDRGAGTEANRTFEDIRAMVRWARGRGDLDENLIDGMKRPTETKPRERFLSADEIRIMWLELADADMWESTRRIIRLCLITGQRVGEITGMTRNEIDLEARLWTIPAARTKNGNEHAVPLSNMAVRVIENQIAAVEALSARKSRPVAPFVFPSPGGRAAVTGGSVPKALKRLEATVKGCRTILDVEPWTPHDLRRTMATHMEMIGISPLVVGHCLNHVSVTRSTITGRVYARYDYMQEKRDALELWADRLGGIVEGGGEVISLVGGSAGA